MTQVQIISLNIRRLGNRLKRKKMFDFIRKNNVHIVLLQETHSTPNTEMVWSNEWKTNSSFFCHGESNARGVAILFKRGFQYQVDKTYMDVNGRFIIMDIKIDEKLITLVNLYAPNNDNPDFFVNIFTKLGEFSCEDLIIGGDFNFVMDVYNDCTNPNRTNNSMAKDTVTAFMDEMLLQDVYRHNHPDKRSYTYTQHHPYTASRIDMFLVNYGLTAGIKSDIKIALNTDHSLIEINLQIDGLKCGKGLWKFNTAHLKDPKFLDFLNGKIDNKVRWFSLHV